MKHWKRMALAPVLAMALSASLKAEQPLANVLFLGDSLTAGFGLSQEESLVTRAEESLQRMGLDVQATQAGVSGDTTTGARARAAWSRPENATHAVVFLGGNDMLRGQSPDAARNNLKDILQTYQSMPVLLIGLQAPGNLGGDEVRRWQEVFVDVAQSRDRVWFVADASAPLRDRNNRVNSRLMLPDNIHPNAQGTQEVVEHILPCLVEMLTQWEPSENCSAPPS